MSERFARCPCRRAVPLVILVIACGLSPVAAAAQGQPAGDPFLVEDFGAEGPDAFDEFVGGFGSWTVDGRLVTSFERDLEGLDESSILWATDGTDEGSGTITELARLRLRPLGTALPSAGLLQSQRDGQTLLWRSDGTPGGTRVVSELPGFVFASARLGDRVVLAVDVFVRFGRGPVYEEGVGEGLWVTDGTAAGTRQLVDTPADSLGLGGAVELGDRLVFPAGDPSTVWTSDGTVAGSGPLSLAPEVVEWFAEATDGEVVLFQGRGPEGLRLYATDGTLGGTRQAIFRGEPGPVRVIADPVYDATAGRFVAILARGPEAAVAWGLDGRGGAEVLAQVPSVTADDFAVLIAHGGRLYLGHVDASGDARQLDLVEDGGLQPLLGVEAERNALVLGTLDDERLLLDLVTTTGTHELWVTDGTGAGTRRLDTLCSEGCFGIQFVETSLYVADSGERYLIHRSSPGGSFDLFLVTVAGAVNLTRLDKPDARVDHVLGDVEGRVVFRASDHPADRTVGRLWVTDGTPGGTRPLPPPNVSERSDLSIVDAARAGDLLAFVERREDPGIQARFDLGYEPAGTHVWLSDGTAAGTREVYAAPFDDELGWGRIFDLVHQGERALFVVLPGELRPGDGRQARVLSVDDRGEVRVLYSRSADPAVDGAPDRFYLVKSGDRVYLKESDGFRALEPGADAFGPLVPVIWVRDGILREGLRREDDNSLPVRLPSGDDLFLTVADAVRGWSLQVTDGTPGGTGELAQRTGRGHDLVRAGGRAWFVGATFDRLFPRIWVSDGTVAGTRPTDLFAEPPHRVDQLHGAGAVLYVETETEDGTRELWASDGTRAGTRRVLGGRPVHASVDFRGRLLFVASDGEIGRELWISNGTAAGTRPVLDLVPGPTPSLPEDLRVVGTVAYFTAFTPERGRELWVTDGSAAGTRRLSDLDPGPAASDPMHLVAVDDLLFFEADDGVVGSELFALPIEGVGDGGEGEIPPRPDTAPLTSPAVPGFRFWVEITPQGQAPIVGSRESACIPETLCVSGALPERTEVFVRVIGPRPNGLLWPVVTRFTPSRVEVWIEQASTGDLRYYDLPATDPETSAMGELTGLFDRDGFVPQ